MEIAFIRPAAKANTHINNVPLNYTHLAAYLREAGHQATILDMVLPGIGTAEIDAQIRERWVRIAGIGCMTCELPDALASIHSLIAGLRASGKGCASMIVPTRMSTASKSEYSIS
jgi:hypothetical protein